EHHSAFLPWQRICKRTGAMFRTIPVDTRGCIEVDALGALMNDRTRILVITHASNVTGAITDLSIVSALTRPCGAILVVDGAQMAQHGPIDVKSLGVDFYALSGHKCYGPTGVGVLWGAGASLARLPAYSVGGGMVERVTVEASSFQHSNLKLEAGTPPIGQAIGLGIALEWLMEQDQEAKQHQEKYLVDKLLQALWERPGVRLLGPEPGQERLPLCSFDLENCHPHDISQLLDEKAVAVRGGDHCAQPLMNALGLTATTRASLALFNDESDVDALLNGLDYAIGELA
ncbi:MAG: aminotransferase class V-fold PLP-dependent enzyme, partial [Pseudomonadales bacterium]